MTLIVLNSLWLANNSKIYINTEIVIVSYYLIKCILATSMSAIDKTIIMKVRIVFTFMEKPKWKKHFYEGLIYHASYTV